MKIRTGAITAATALALALGATSPAVAAPPSVERSEGSFASATFVKREAITCANGSQGTRRIESSYEGDAWVVSGGKKKDGWSVENDESHLNVVVRDSCTGEVHGFGGSLMHRGQLSMFPKTAKSVHAWASVDIYLPTDDYASGDASLDFTANSRPSKSKERKREITAGGKTFTRSVTTVRNADVAGSVSLNNTGLEYLDDRNLIEGATLVEASFGTSTYTIRTRTRG